MQPETAALVESALEGTVLHQRQMVIEHRFEYRMWMVLARVGTSELPRLLRPRLSRYMSAQKVLEIAGHAGLGNDADVWVLTQPSMFGRSFNPVSFYFVQVDGQLRTTIAHVTNTPWNEDHCYVLEQAGSDTWVFDKDFHVSPFMPMALRYRWRLKLNADKVSIHIQLFEADRRVFTAALNLRAVRNSRWLPVKLRMKYPAQNLMTMGRIYWQAAVLKIKGARFHAHPDKSAVVQDRPR